MAKSRKAPSCIVSPPSTVVALPPGICHLMLLSNVVVKEDQSDALVSGAGFRADENADEDGLFSVWFEFNGIGNSQKLKP